VLDSVRTFLHQGDTEIILLLALSCLVLLLVIGWLLQAFRVRRLTRRLEALTRNMDGRNLEETLVAHMETVDAASRRMDLLEQAVAVLQAQIPGCLQRAGMVRYDAFEDVGGEQSFSVALLDARGDGILLTSVYSRLDMRIYAKSIQSGHASHPLSREEERAITQQSQ
jgi:hypothetical protein